jgi:signal peptidase I
MLSEKIYSMSGNSMIPTLSEPMILETSRAEYYSQGDVVVFNDKNSNTIVHRIVKLTKSGFITRGDNNLTDDEPIVQQDILGKVVAAYRGQKQYRVSEGKNGYRVHRYLQVRKNILRYPQKILSFVYRILSGTDFFAKLLPGKYKPNIIQYQNGQSQVYIGKILAGRYDVRRQHWIILRPWRIFINEKSLPHPNQVKITQ